MKKISYSCGDVTKAIVFAICMFVVEARPGHAQTLKLGMSTQQSLAELIQQAINNNPQIRVQQANNRSADADVETARWQFYPTPSLSVERASSQGNDTIYANGAQVRYLRLQQPLYTWGRLTAGLSKAQTRKEASSAAIEESKQQIALRVVQTYIDWVTATLRREAFLEGLRDYQKFESLITRRINTGVSPSADLLSVQLRLVQTQGDILQSTDQQDSARIKLSQLLGQSIDNENLKLEVWVHGSTILAHPAQTWLNRAEQISPALTRLTAQANAARMELDERKSSMLPELYLRIEHQSGSPYTTNPPADQTRLFVGFTGNIGPGLSGLSALDSGKAKYEAALEEIDAGKRNLHEQLSSDLSSLTSSVSRYAALHTSYQFAQNLVTGGERQFLAGKKSWQDLMNTSRDLIQAKVQLVEMQALLTLLTWRIPLLSDNLHAVLQPQYFLDTKP